MPAMPEPGPAAPGRPAGTWLAFDYGLRRIGVAVGQGITASANPLAAVDSRDGRPDWAAISALIDQWRPRGLVVGLPRTLEGGEHPLAARIERFCRQLAGRYGLPVHTVDERLSSREAESRLREARRQGRRRTVHKQEVDSMAAAILLENWFTGETDGR